jgi:type I restriction enzyme S subunit
MRAESWKDVELGDVCDNVSVGLAVSVTPFIRPTGVKLIRNQNIRPNQFDSTSVAYLDPTFAEKNKSKRVKSGDVIAVRTGSNIGEACVVPAEFDGSQTFTTLVARPTINKLSPIYLSHHINSEIGRAEVNRLMAGGGKPNLNAGELRRYRLLVPSLDEQSKISQLLSTWDAAIHVTEKLIEMSRIQKAALTQHLLRGRKRGAAASITWEYPRANYIFRSVSRRGYQREELLAVTQGQGVIPRSRMERRVVMPNGETGTYKLVLPGDFVVSLRSFQGGFEYSRFRGLVSPAYTVLVSTREICGDFFRHYFKSPEFIARLAVAVIGIRDGKQVSYEDFLFMRLPLPPLSEQQRIAEILNNADESIVLLLKSLATLHRQKRDLACSLLTGKRRVKLDSAVPRELEPQP